MGEPVTGGREHFPMLDRHGRQIEVGDRLRAQVCIGPYGQTKVVEVVVTEAHWPYCAIYGTGPKECISTTFDFDQRVLRCATRHVDFEHGHETWAEVL